MQENVKIIHTADLHLGAEFSFLDEAKRKQRKSELRLTLEKIFNICKTNGIDFLLLAGDIFESNAVNTAEVEAFFGGVESIPETQVIVSSGNHDPLTTDSPYFSHSPLPNLHIIGSDNVKIDFDDKNCSVYGSAFFGCYKDPQRPFECTVDKNRINIAVIHGDTAPGSKYNYISREFLANSGMDYVALGHIHTHTDVEKIGETYFAYSGCPEPHGFDEIGKIGIIAGNISKVKSEFQFLPISKRTHETVTVDIGGVSSNGEAAQSIEKSLSYIFGEDYGKNLYKIVLTGETNENLIVDKAELISRFSDKVFFMKIKDNTTLKTDFELLKKEKSLKGEFVRIMLEKIENEPQNEELKKALNIGLKAFSGEVKYDEDK